MSQYLTSSMGPGSIGALVSGAALQHAPTIGANAPKRNVNAITHGAYQVPSLGCSGCVGTVDSGVENGNGGTKSFLGMLLLPAAVIAGLWYFTR